MPVKPAEHWSFAERKARHGEPRSGGVSSERGKAKRAGNFLRSKKQAIGQRGIEKGLRKPLFACPARTGIRLVPNLTGLRLRSANIDLGCVINPNRRGHGPLLQSDFRLRGNDK